MIPSANALTQTSIHRYGHPYTKNKHTLGLFQDSRLRLSVSSHSDLKLHQYIFILGICLVSMFAVAPQWLYNDHILCRQRLFQMACNLTGTNPLGHIACSYSNAVVAFTYCVCVCICVCVFYELVFTLWLLLMPFRLPAAHKGIIMGQCWLRLALWHTHTRALFLPLSHTDPLQPSEIATLTGVCLSSNYSNT